MRHSGLEPTPPPPPGSPASAASIQAAAPAATAAHTRSRTLRIARKLSAAARGVKRDFGARGSIADERVRAPGRCVKWVLVAPVTPRVRAPVGQPGACRVLIGRPWGAAGRGSAPGPPSPNLDLT